MIKLIDIPKFVINLNRRKDRLESFQDEMNYIGWEFQRFEAFDTNSYIGCALSHQAIARIALEKNYDYTLVMEDDIYFMPYAKDIISNIENELFNKSLDWAFFHLAPSIHRPLNLFNDNLLDLTNLPPKDESKHRGIYGTSSFILTKKACEYIIEWNTNKFIENSHQQIPIDEYLDKVVYPNVQSYCATLPIVVQKTDFSDINKTRDNNHYLMTYNWNVYCPTKLNQSMFSIEYCNKIKYNEH